MSPRKVLIVDDSPINRQILCAVLRADYEILEAADGEEALSVLRREYTSVSAVLLDIVMPGIDGYEVLARIRADEKLSPIPVIIVTGSEDEASRTKALTFGANDFILKPFNPDVIKHCLHNNIALREAAAAVYRLQTDRLTGVWNREAFFQKAAAEIEKQPAGYYILGCVDIDNFKVINDQYGSETGDRMLKSLADAMQESCRINGGICGRIFADWFICLYRCDLVTAGVIGPAMLEARISRDTGLRPTLSVGRYVVEDKSLSVSAMYDRAVIARNAVKGRYDTHVAVYNECMRSRIVYEQSIVNDMNAALTHRQFEVWFQPQYNHATGALIGAEALVRWRHPEKGLIPPGDFIPVFERNGFIYSLDKFVWEEVCRYLCKWLDQGRSPLPVSVNISRYDILRPDIVSVITGLIEKYKLPVELLRLEITESAFAESTKEIVSVVKQLIARGFTLEIDDFGSGYSSLNTLKSVPAQVVKLDIRFFEDDDDSQRSGNIIESVVRMTKWLGMSVIAEGVEQKAQADYLRSIGCNYIQGFLYAKPMTAESYEALCKGADKEEKLLTMESVKNLDNSAFWDPKSMDTLIFNSYVGGACIFEYHDGHVELLRVNNKYLETFGTGISSEKVFQDNIADYLDSANRGVLFSNIRRAAETGDETTCEIYTAGLYGIQKPVYIRSTVRVIARAGDRCLLYCTVANITAQREAEQAEREVLEQMQCMMRDMPGGFRRMRVRADGSVQHLYCNDGFCRLVGMDHDSLMARYASNAFAGVHPDDIAIVRDAIARMLANGEAHSARYRLRHGKRGYVWLSIFGRVTMDASGNAFLNVYYTDATAEVREEEKQRELLDNLPGGAGLYEYARGKLSVTYLNKSYWALVGREATSYAGLLPLSALHPEDVAALMGELASAIEQKRDLICDIRLLHASGKYLPVHLVGRIVPGKPGRYSIYTTFTPLSGAAGTRLCEGRAAALEA